VIPLGVVVLLAIRPQPTRRIVPAALILLGLYGFAVARDTGFEAYAGGTYGLTAVGDGNMETYLVLPQAYAFLLLGGLLSWRSADLRSRWAPVQLGRLARPQRPGQLWALLLLPVVIMVAALVSPNVWLGSGVVGICCTLAVLVGAVQLVRRHPDLAACCAVAGLIGVGLAGIYLVATYSSAGWPLPTTSYGYILYGVVDVSSQSTAYVALVEALACVAFGVWLLPRAVPGAATLLGWASDADLIRRVQRLTESRAVAVDTAAADLRRLERDLHDGAQARLVALGMNLRAVERLIPTSPDAALALVAEARETSARALAELRELVRGVHPPVLADRGLGDAIRALALDSPLRIQCDISLPGRLPAPVETACYFAVAEVLTNAAKHSGARDGRIAAERADGVLRISVTDFGLGGADPANGTGLAGIERRLASFDGIVAVSSPVGGPTMVVIEVPCAMSTAALPAG
jgi:signal transduction histidine kinase